MSDIEDQADDARRAMMQLLFSRAELLIDRQEKASAEINKSATRILHLNLDAAKLIYELDQISKRRKISVRLEIWFAHADAIMTFLSDNRNSILAVVAISSSVCLILVYITRKIIS